VIGTTTGSVVSRQNAKARQGRQERAHVPASPQIRD
jgi:hypothetical protein